MPIAENKTNGIHYLLRYKKEQYTVKYPGKCTTFIHQHSAILGDSTKTGAQVIYRANDKYTR